jgi:hypothetical protein
MHTGHPHHWARMSAVLLSAALALTTQAGPLEPPVPPGTPTMRPIDQPGSYYLAQDISTTGTGHRHEFMRHRPDRSKR